MEWNIYKDWLDPVLYRQMVSMIYQLSSNADKEAFLKQERENSLFYGICEHSMEEEYNLHYPGEVLERMKERRTMTKPVYRALGLALAGTSCIQETCMFNGTQKSGFWKQFGKVLGEKDLCYLAVRCLLATKDRKLWVDALHQYPYEKVEEMIFILSVFPESDTLWQKLKGKIAACFGRERRLSVYEGWHFYAWIAMKYEKRLKNDRTKETAVLKQVVKLSQTNAANANGALEEQLIKNGYKKEEVIFLNGILTGARRYLDPNSLTAEKIAVKVLKTFLPGEKMYPDVVYELCETFLRKYDCFPVRLGGQEKIQNCLYGMKVENVRTFLTLFPFRKNGMKEWHYINLNQEKWHCMATQLKEEEFEKCVNDTLRNGTFEKPELESYLAAYQKLTGREYVEIFWKKIDYDLRHVFHLLSENEILDAVGLMKQFLKEYREMRNKEPDPDAFEPIPFIGEADTGEDQTGEAEKVFGEKWDSMLYYLKADMEDINTMTSFSMLKLVITQIGIEGIPGILEPWSMIQRTFSLYPYGISRGECEICRPLLERGVHQELFMWIEEHLFLTDVGNYISFLRSILLKDSTGLWMEPKEAMQMAKEILPYLEDSSGKETLRRKYMSEEELRSLEMEKEWKQIQETRMRKLEEEKKIKKEFNLLLRKNKGTNQLFEQIYDFYYYGRYAEDSLRARIILSYMRDYLDRRGKIVTSKEEIKYLLLLFQNLYKNEKIELEGIRQMVDLMEVA